MRTVIGNVLAFDGSGQPGVLCDLVMNDEVIESVRPTDASNASDEAADTVIDGTGLAAAPGFIDVHTHDDFAVIAHPDMAFKNRGGVTTCVVGNCGFGAAPHQSPPPFAASMHPGHDLPLFDGYSQYMAYLDQNQPGVNVGVLAGHGSIRAAALGPVAHDPDHEPTPSELATMCEIMSEALDAGVFGYSSGLVYEPGRHASTAELIAMAKTMTGTGALYATHMRDEGEHLLEAVTEAIRIGREATVAVQISHHKAAGKTNWGKVSESLALIEAAQAEGLQVNADQYPYTAGSTTLDSVVGNYTIAEDGSLPPANLVIASCERQPSWEGQSVADLAEHFDCSPAEAVENVLQTDPLVTVILHMMDEADVKTVMAHASTIIGSDGLPTLEGKPHPRLYNTFARVLGHYCRDLELFPLEEAIARMTGRSADAFSLTDRGYLRPGLAADVVVFDPTGIVDRGTFEQPNQYPDGIHHVFVNGVAVVSDGQPTGARPGQVLRRPGASGTATAAAAQ